MGLTRARQSGSAQLDRSQVGRFGAGLRGVPETAPDRASVRNAREGASLSSQTEADDADGAAALGPGPLQGRRALPADGRDEHFPLAARNGVGRPFNVTKRRRRGFAFWPCWSRSTGPTGLASGARGSGRPGLAALAFGTRWPERSRLTAVALGAGCARQSGFAPLAFRSLRTRRPLLPGFALGARGAGRARWTGRTRRAGRTLRTWRAGRALRTSCSNRALRALASRQQDRGGDCDHDAQTTHCECSKKRVLQKNIARTAGPGPAAEQLQPACPGGRVPREGCAEV